MSFLSQVSLTRTPGMELLIDTLKESHWDWKADPYGEVTASLFDLAEAFLVWTGENLPGFRPSPIFVSDGASDVYEMLTDTVTVTESDVRAVYSLLSRAQSILEAMGRD